MQELKCSILDRHLINKRKNGMVVPVESRAAVENLWKGKWQWMDGSEVEVSHTTLKSMTENRILGEEKGEPI